MLWETFHTWLNKLFLWSTPPSTDVHICMSGVKDNDEAGLMADGGVTGVVRVPGTCILDDFSVSGIAGNCS